MKKLAVAAVVSLVVCSCATRPAIPKDAVFLGERVVPFSGARDVVQVGAYDGWFRSLFIVVEKNDIQLFNLVVTYGNDEKEGFDTRLDFAADSRSHALPLEGGKRRIRSIAFEYKTVGSWLDGKARVAVYGLR
jgi:hypothetical protein